MELEGNGGETNGSDSDGDDGRWTGEGEGKGKCEDEGEGESNGDDCGETVKGVVDGIGNDGEVEGCCILFILLFRLL